MTARQAGTRRGPGVPASPPGPPPSLPPVFPLGLSPLVHNGLENTCLSGSGAGKRDGDAIEIRTISFFKDVFHSNSSPDSLIVVNLPSAP